MWRFVLQQTGKFILWLLGAVLAAAALSALASQPGNKNFAATFIDRCLTFARLDLMLTSLKGTTRHSEK